MNIEEAINKMKLLSEYDPKTALNEWRVDCSGWINIGVIPNSSPFFGANDNNDMYVMVNPNAEKIDDLSTFKYRNVAYSTKPDGTGATTTSIPSYKLEDIEIYPEYRDTYYGDLFLGRKKGEDGERQHKEFMSKLNIVEGERVILKHSSSVKITDGYISYGKKNSWSNNSDIGIYFWGSKHIGRDQSNVGQYTYICTVDLNDIYDFETNLERFPSLRSALKAHPYCAQQWQNETDVIVVNTMVKTPIKAIRDNSNGTVYNSEWQPIDMKVEGKQTKKNFIHEYKPDTCNNAGLVPINELNAKTMLQRHGESGFIVISPCRGYADFNLNPTDKTAKQKLSEINNDRIRKMISQIKASGYSYTPVYGGFIENIGTEDEENVYERSFVVYNKKRDGSEGDMNDLVKFGQALAKQYNQDSFLVKANGQKPKYITKDGNIDMEFSGNTSFNDFSQEYFTDLHKNTEKYSNVSNRKPTRFSYTESYINPGPQCYSERHVRSLNGEVFLSETSRRQKAQQAVNGKLNNLRSFAILTSDNPMGKKLSSAENSSRYESLMKDLKLGSFIYFPVKGKYNDIEQSVIIYNISLDDAIWLGDTYEQESIIFCIPNISDKTVHYEYWERNNVGSPLKKTIERDEYIDATDDRDMFTQISRKFKIRIPFFEHVEKVCNFINNRMNIVADSVRLLDESVNNSYTGKHRMICRNRLYKRSVISEMNNPKFVDEGYQERKEAFRKLHERAVSENEMVMERFYGIKTNDNKPVLIEHVTLDRVLKKHGANGMINISANRSDMPKEYNEENTRKLIELIQNSGFSYLPTYGGYRGTNGVEDDYEPSFVVFNYDAKDGKPRDFNELYKRALEWCGTFNQNSVLIKAPNKNPIYVNKDGNKVNSDESNRYWKNDPKQEFFTSFKSKDDVDKEIKEKLMGKYKTYCHKNNIPLTKDGFEKFYQEHLSDIDSIGRRYTYDIRFECYVNPMPLQISERMRRRGEVMIWE
jgi:hypothetical protein